MSKNNYVWLDNIMEDLIIGHNFDYARKAIIEKHEELLQANDKRLDTVDRFEVIDDTGRAYVKGSIYKTPVKIELSYQDDNRTLKVFVQPRNERNK